MKGFKLICAQCGSDNILEKTANGKMHFSNDLIKKVDGIERKCQDCCNESFLITKTWQDI